MRQFFQTGILRAMTHVRFIVAASPSIGLGHLRRCQVLANAFVDKGAHCTFKTEEKFAVDLLEEEGYQVEHSAANDAGGADILVFDGHDFGLDRSLAWRDQYRMTLAIDDLADLPRSADILVNPHIYGDTLDYKSYPVGELLLGGTYALINQKFFDLRADNDRAGDRVLVAFGGSDDGAFAIPTAAALLERSDAALEVVLSPLRPPSKDLGRINDPRVTIHQGADIEDLMRRCTVYCGAAGVTSSEALAAGLPISVAQIVDNQRFSVKAFDKRGLHALSAFDPDKLAENTVDLINDPGASSPVPDLQPGGPGRIVAACLARLAR